MRLRTTRRVGNSHGPIKTVAALVAAMFASTAAPAFDWSASDLSTQYQDNFGTLPVTSVEQPVGLVLDRSKGGAQRGPEIAQNGGFDQDVLWTKGNGWSIANGRAIRASTSNGSVISQAYAFTAGKWYEVSFDYINTTAIFYATFRGGTTTVGPNIAAGSGRYRAIMLAQTGNASFDISTSVNTAEGQFDNYSVRELTGTNTWSDGAAVFSGTASRVSPNVYRIFTADTTLAAVSQTTLTTGKWYEATFNIDSVTTLGGGLSIDNTTQTIPGFSTVGPKRAIFLAGSTTFMIKRASSACDIQISAINVRELPGNHLIQPTSASRPTLTARVNRLSATEALDNATYWAKSGSGVVTVTPNVFVAPDGTTTGDEVAQDGAGTSQAIYQTFPDAVTAGVPLKFRVSFRAGTVTSTALSIFNITSATHVVDSAVIVSGPGAISGTTFRNLTGLTTGAWTTVELTCNAPVAGNAHRCIIYPNGTGGGTTGASVGVWGAHAEQSTSLSRYQRVNTPTDYDTVGFAKGWRFDGTDDGMYTSAAVDFSSTDKVTIVGGVRKLSDASSSVLLELTSAISNNGSFGLFAPSAAVANWGFAVRGTTLTTAYQSGVASPAAGVLTGRADIAAPSNVFRNNGNAVASVGTTLGTGNFANAVLYFGRRNNTSAPFLGICYGMRGIGRNISPDELGWLEAQAKLDMSNNL